MINSTKKSLQIILFFVLFNTGGVFAQVYDYLNVNLLGRYDDTTFVANNWVNSKYAGCWGWYNPVDGKEYAILGGSNGTYIIEISIPTNPVLRDYVPGVQIDCVWREYKTYGNYLYHVSDDQSPNTFQIIDLSYLPDSVHVVHNGTTFMERCHTIFIDGNKLYGGSPKGGLVGNGGTSMAVFSLANPVAPVLLRTLNQDYPAIGSVHDMFVHNDTVYASCGYDAMHIYKFNANNTFTEIGNLTTYIDQGYNHMSGVTDNGDVMVMMDEVPNQLSVKVVDVSTINNPQVVSTFKSSLGDTPHNPFVLGNDYVVCANYQDGVQIYDISNPLVPVRTGYFDTHYQTSMGPNSYGYVGCWGAYPYLPSGNIIAGDMQNGLYVLNASVALGISEQPHNSDNYAHVFYNEAGNNFQLSLNMLSSQKVRISITDMTGRTVHSLEKDFSAGKQSLHIAADKFAKGIYAISVLSNKIDFVKKVCKPD